MRSTPFRPGATLLELTIVLLLVGVLTGLAVPPLSRGLDRFAVRGARDVLLAAVARARMAAVARGGARLILDVSDAVARIESALDGSLVEPEIDLRRRHGVTLSIEREGSDSVEIRFDELGIGRTLGATIGLRRGRARAGITVAGYGRVRTW